MSRGMPFPYEMAVNPALVNMDPDALSTVVEMFRHQHARGAFPGGQLIIRRHGKMVLNLAIGLARGLRASDEAGSMDVEAETAFPVYSAGKPLFAIAIAMLEERGLIQLEAPISETIPEFSSHGKEQLTILDLLTHTAGIIVPSLQRDYKRMGDRGFLLDLIIDARPMYKRGTFAYMPWESGIILCEVVRRVTGQTLAEFIADEIAVPLDLPSLRYGLANRALNQLAYSYWLGSDKCMIASCNVANNFEAIFNSMELFTSMNPSTSLVTDAASLAIFYEFLINKGVTRTGKQLVSERAINQYTTRVLSGWNKSFHSLLSVSPGFMVGTRFMPSVYGWWNTAGCFGHAGALSSLAFGDSKKGLAVAITTNGNRSIPDFTKRFMPLASRIRQACLL